MAWDPTKPAGSQKLRLSEDDIRDNFDAIDTVIGTMLTAEAAITATAAELNQLDGVEVGGSASGDIVTTDGGQTQDSPDIDTPDIDGGTIDNATLGSGSNNTYSDLCPSGTIMLFGQASAPTGWTKKTDWQDGAMIVINSDANGTALDSGGSAKPQTAHTHTADNEGSHTHTLPIGTESGSNGILRWVHRYSGSVISSSKKSLGGSINDAAPTNRFQTYAGSAHSHTINANTAFYYQEAIWCTKD